MVKERTLCGIPVGVSRSMSETLCLPRRSLDTYDSNSHSLTVRQR